VAFVEKIGTGAKQLKHIAVAADPPVAVMNCIRFVF
jgi:hypothetical protein